MKEEQRVIERVYTVNLGFLFSFYIPKPQSLTSRSDLELLYVIKSSILWILVLLY